MLIFQAGMAESADALASGASGGNLVEVQVFLPAPYWWNKKDAPVEKPVNTGFFHAF